MVFDSINLKSEALLLICRDIITTYENKQEGIFESDEALKNFVNIHVSSLKKGIDAILQGNEYYLRNARISRIKIILHYYQSISNAIEKAMEKDKRFNPTMLCFAMLATWFKEFGFESRSKEFIFFALYPYGEIYDTLIIKIEDLEYKKLNITMIQMAEKIMMKLYKEK